MDTKKKFGELFRSLQPGDQMMVPIMLGNLQAIAYSVVLRRGSGDELYLSAPRASPVSTPYLYNPVRWDEKLGVVMGNDGKTIPFLIEEIQVTRGEGAAVVREYEAVPRSSGDFKLSPQIVSHLMASSDTRVLEGIANNGEAGTTTEQLALAMAHLGMSSTLRELAGLNHLVEAMIKKAIRDKGIAIINLRRQHEETAEAAPPGHTTH